MTKNKRGKYIVFEGLDASGKSTQCQLLLEYLTNNGIKFGAYSEPGGSPIGDKIRQILKDGTLARQPQSNLDLFTICRRELVIQNIIPAVNRGINIIVDRNWWSSVAYQGFGEGMDSKIIIAKTKDALGDYFMPDAVVLIDVPVSVVHERLDLRGGKSDDYFEQKGGQFFEKVRDGYLWLAKKYGVPIIDGNQSREAVFKDVLEYLRKIDCL